MQKDVARMLGVDRCSVRNWEAGRTGPRSAVKEWLLKREAECAENRKRGLRNREDDDETSQSAAEGV